MCRLKVVTVIWEPSQTHYNPLDKTDARSSLLAAAIGERAWSDAPVTARTRLAHEHRRGEPSDRTTGGKMEVGSIVA